MAASEPVFSSTGNTTARALSMVSPVESSFLPSIIQLPFLAKRPDPRTDSLYGVHDATGPGLSVLVLQHQRVFRGRKEPALDRVRSSLVVQPHVGLPVRLHIPRSGPVGHVPRHTAGRLARSNKASSSTKVILYCRSSLLESVLMKPPPGESSGRIRISVLRRLAETSGAGRGVTRTNSVGRPADRPHTHGLEPAVVDSHRHHVGAGHPASSVS